MTFKRILVLTVIVAICAAAGYRVWQIQQKRAQATAGAQRGSGASGASTARLVNVSVTEARRGQIREELEITGALKPKEQVDITSKVTGRLERLGVEVGDYVQRGQTLAVLESAEIAQQVRQAEAAQAVAKATVDQRQAELSSAQADQDRAKQLLDAGLISRQDYDTKVTAYRVFQSQLALTRAQVQQTEAALRELRIQLGQTQIKSPISGFVSQKYVDVGAVIGPSTPIVQVVNLSTLVTVANVPERQIAKLRPGAKATVYVDALGDTPFTGHVARIGPVLDPATRSAFVEVEIPNRANALRAEMFARVKLDLATMRNAILVPRDSLVYRGGQAGVFVVEQKRPEFRPVDAGSIENQHIEVLGNLAVGTTVVTRGAALLTEGDQIQIVQEKEEAGRIEEPPPPPAKPRARSTSREQAG
jgi:HlyD family secretion protein